MRRRRVKHLIWGLVLALLANTDVAAANEFAFEFATTSQGQEIISQRDEYITRMSPFDRAARLKTDRNVSEAEYLDFLRSQVGEWSASDRATLNPILGKTRSLVANFELSWPDQIYLIKTNELESTNTHYTRSNSIVLPQSDVQLAVQDPESLTEILAHELFHVLSRHNPELREKLYAAIGFLPCDEVRLPADLAEIQITNPDAPISNYCIRVAIDRSDVLVMPLLSSKFGKYDVKRGGDLFDYLQVSFLRVPAADPPPPSMRNLPAYQFETIDRLTGFYDQVGRNAMGYMQDSIPQPEEILADNFSLLVRGMTNVPSPEFQTKIRAVLAGARAK